jgi:hypothetical protein
MEDVQKDICKMKFKRGQQKTVDREEWVPFIKTNMLSDGLRTNKGGE